MKIKKLFQKIKDNSKIKLFENNVPVITTPKLAKFVIINNKAHNLCFVPFDDKIKFAKSLYFSKVITNVFRHNPRPFDRPQVLYSGFLENVDFEEVQKFYETQIRKSSANHLYVRTFIFSANLLIAFAYVITKTILCYDYETKIRKNSFIICLLDIIYRNKRFMTSLCDMDNFSTFSRNRHVHKALPLNEEKERIYFEKLLIPDNENNIILLADLIDKVCKKFYTLNEIKIIRDLINIARERTQIFD